MSYKWCAVPMCRSTSVHTPEKLFVNVPKDVKKRNSWLRLARRNPKDISYRLSVIYFCEDHFDMQKDMANYFQHKMGFSQRIKMVEGALPSKFECQSLVAVQNCLYDKSKSIISKKINLEKGARKHSSQQTKTVNGQQEGKRKNKSEATDSYISDVHKDTIYKVRQEKNIVALPSKSFNQLDLEKINCNEGSFRTISIEVLKPDDTEDYYTIDPITTVQEAENDTDQITKECNAEPMPSKEVMNYDNSITTVSHHTEKRSKSADTVDAVDKSVQVCLKPKFRSKAVQTMVNTVNSLPYEHSIIDKSTSSLIINRHHCYIQPSIKEIRELEMSVRISDRKLYRSWEAVKDSKDPDAYENLLDEVKNKQKTLSCMLQLIENRQALLKREQENNENEDDGAVSLPPRRHQDTRRCLKRRKRAHETRSEHKTQNGPKQVTLYVTGSSTVDETESTRSSLELPSLELSQGPTTPNIMYFTTN